MAERVSFRCQVCGWHGRGTERRVKLVVAAHVLLCHPDVWELDAQPGEEAEVLGALSWKDLEVAIGTAMTARVNYCSMDGCGRRVYYDRLCRPHHIEKHGVIAAETACGACGTVTEQTIACGRCRRRVCFDCYGVWDAMACAECVGKARGADAETAE